ncbi:MAG: glycerophosphodiester phosphodiesterase family protein [Planctomycetales bacterium]|nr:glycerophosphodiester phosphodiesterase family protein [Planctomycetales bacterium]
MADEPANTSANAASAPVSSQYQIDAASANGLRELLHYGAELPPVVSAHRGGAGPGLPENCIATFEQTLAHGYAMLEVDPRLTRDGVVVLHHDATLDRTTTGTGPISEFSLGELKHLKLKDSNGVVTDHRINTLSEAFEWARGKAILVIDSKDLSVAQRVEQIEKHNAEAYAMIIAGSLKAAQECYQLNPNIMMEVMIPDRDRLGEFEAAGIPWDRVVAFVGHQPTEDQQLIQMLHDRGVLVMGGTSRNLDLELSQRRDGAQLLEQRYRDLVARGIDLIETDLPRSVWPILFGDSGGRQATRALRRVQISDAK